MQWVEEVRVEPGTNLTLLAKHDTYSISFAWHAPQDASLHSSTHVESHTSCTCSPQAEDRAKDINVKSETSEAAIPLQVFQEQHYCKLLCAVE